MWRFIADYHTHTRYSHGKGTVEQNVRAAIQCGLRSVGIADHGPANWGRVGIRRLSDYDALLNEVENLRRIYPEITILAGAEANIVSYDGDIDLPMEYVKALDQILIGFHTMIIPKHWHEGMRFIKTSLASRLGKHRYHQACEANTQALIAAVHRYPVKIVTHPGLKVSIDCLQLAEECKKYGTSLEINVRHGIQSIEHIKRTAVTGVSFALSSDAHSPQEVGRLERAAHWAQLAGLSAAQIINVEEV